MASWDLSLDCAWLLRISGSIDTLEVVVEFAYRAAQEKSIVFRQKILSQDLKKAVREEKRENARRRTEFSFIVS